MKAAIVRSFEQPPEYGDFDEPVPQSKEVLVSVKAAALSRLVQGRASGQHYSSQAHFPFVPGVDGVGTLPDGRRVYFVSSTPPFGAMAERVAVRPSLCVPLPDDLDDVTAAAAANPGMSSSAALLERARLIPGETVLINGATGVAGRLAIQIAKYLGAGKVLATGRNAASIAGLEALGADVTIPLASPDQPGQSSGALVQTFQAQIQEHGVNIILDYLWGSSAESLIAAAAGHGSPEGEPRIRFVQIGSLAGNTITLPGGALRSSGLELMGSGLGSVPVDRLVHAIGLVFEAFVPKGFKISAQPVPLTEVNSTWASSTADRIVYTL